MPYENTAELPESVKNSLPNKGQKMYKEAFNNAWDQYKDPEDRRKSDNREETAHRVAWSAVKQKYEKSAKGEWQPKQG